MFEYLRAMIPGAFAFLVGLMPMAACADTLFASHPEVVIASDHNAKFVVVHDGTAVSAIESDPLKAERFRMIRLPNNRVAFYASNGRIVRAGFNQPSWLSASSPHVAGWETFEIVRQGNRSGLRSVQSGLFVEADRRNGGLRATATKLEGLALFSVLNAPARNRGGAPSARAPQESERQVRVVWSGDWSRIWLASPNGNLHRAPAEPVARFTISDRNEVTMTSGCNTVRAFIAVTGAGTRFERLTMGKKRCSNHAQGYEEGMARAMAKVRSYDYREGQIAFLDENRRTLIQIGR